MFHLSVFVFLLCLYTLHVTAQDQPITFNCADTPNACENFCYVTNCGGLPNSYTKVPEGFDPNDNRKASGVRRSGRPAPCRDTSFIWTTEAQAEYGTTDLDTDEWPPASATQGGTGASLRCMPSGDNRRAGAKLKNVPRGTQFQIILTEMSYPNNIFCNNKCETYEGGLDHQFQWDSETDTYSGPSHPADTTTVGATKMRRVRRTSVDERTNGTARFLTSRGDEITAFTVKGQELEIREGSVIDKGFEDEAVVVKRLA